MDGQLAAAAGHHHFWLLPYRSGHCGHRAADDEGDFLHLIRVFAGRRCRWGVFAPPVKGGLEWSVLPVQSVLDPAGGLRLRDFMPFIHDDFLLATPLARRLYHEAAAVQPIIDFHSHLPPRDVAEDRRFANLFEIWLAGDHYKWRAMRANGEPEAFCTGDAAPYDKFLALARTIPHCLRNPLYHWCHLELKRYFGIDELLTPESAPRIWEQANARLTGPDRTARGVLSDFKVELVATTDDPADPLTHHEAIAASDCATRILPTFRPDNALRISQPAFFNPWIEKLERASGTDATTFRGLLAALEKRHDDFHAAGGRLSDHGLTQATDRFCTMAEAAAVYDKARRSLPVTPDEERQFAAFIMVHIGRLNARKGWTMQLHLGPLRGNSTRRLRALGPDTGFDS
ncbi:MAG: glucuronate isomerase, partial [Verrucomicrobiaceae bacterium]